MKDKDAPPSVLSFGKYVRKAPPESEKARRHHGASLRRGHGEHQGHESRTLEDRIGEHRVRLVQEGTDAEQEAKPEEATYIERIEIVEGMNCKLQGVSARHGVSLSTQKAKSGWVQNIS